MKVSGAATMAMMGYLKVCAITSIDVLYNLLFLLPVLTVISFSQSVSDYYIPTCF